MKSYIALFAAGLTALPAVAGYEYLDFVSLEARQDVSPEKFECHSNCGNAIIQGRESTNDEHCESEEWRELYDECMLCAHEFDIWDDYGDGVTEAAEPCGLSPTPVAAAQASESVTVTTSSTTTPTSSEAPEESGDGDDDSAGSHMTSSASMMLFAMIAAAGLM